MFYKRISCVWFAVVVFLAIRANTLEWGLDPENSNRYHSGTARVPIEVTPDYPEMCPLRPACDGTGLACIKSCKGLKTADYQSCSGCNMYATCVYGRMYDKRPCAASTVWDETKKRCEWKSKTCSEDPCAHDFNVDVHSGTIDVSNEYYTWLNDSALTNTSGQCDESGLLVIHPPRQANVITMFMVLDGDARKTASFHIAGTRYNDGFGDILYGFAFGADDAEMHTNYGVFAVFTSMRGNYQYYRDRLYPSAPGNVYMCITIRNGFLYISGSYLRVTLVHKYLFNVHRPIYVGINRPVSDDVFSRMNRGGGGLCMLNISWSK